jgi:hypothetical protein
MPRGLLLMACSLLATVILTGCSRHPQATSRESMEFIKQVYTACNTKNESRLAECEKKLSKLKEAKQVGEREVKSFEIILKLAREAQWKQAQNIAMQFAQDQVR